MCVPRKVKCLLFSSLCTENLPQLSNCAQEAGSACTRKGEDCAYMMGLDDATDNSVRNTTASRTSLSPIMELNDAERARWDRWEERDDLSGRNAKKTIALNESSDHKHASQDVESELGSKAKQDSPTGTRSAKVQHSSSSSLDSSTNRMHTAQKREQAQSMLLNHAKKAQELNREQVESILSMKTEDTDVLSTEDKSTATGSLYVPQDVLQKFSSMLRNDKVEVLKLNRHGKWQVRYITVSKEVSWLKNKGAPSTPNSSQCPQALLWYKAVNTKNTGLAGLKNDGRGGFLFSQLHKVERDPNVNPPTPIPKKLKAKYTQYAGIKIRYLCEEGERDLLFCFQDPSDAKAFCTTVDIIHQVVMRSADDSQS